MDLTALIAIGIGISVFTGVGAGVGMGIATSKGAEAVARQPEASGKINAMLLIGLAFMETTAIYGFVIAILMLGKL